MDYKTLVALNERSKQICKSRGMVYVNSIESERKEEASCITLEDYTEESIMAMPEELYICEYDDSGYSIYSSNKILLSTLIAGIITCELWVANIEIFDKKEVLEAIEILPKYTPVRMVYSYVDKMARVFVDNVAVAAFCIAELMSNVAVEDIFQKTLHNLRSYGFITLPIESTLKSEVKRGVEEVRKETNGVVFGVGKDYKYCIMA